MSLPLTVARRLVKSNLVVVERVHQRDESPRLRFLVERQQRDVPDEDGVKQTRDLQVVAGPERLKTSNSGSVMSFRLAHLRETSSMIAK